MGYDLAEDGTLSELPMRNIDTGMGLERMAAILQDVPSVFETDLLRPLIELGEELSGRSYGEDAATTRAMRIVADHSRGTAFLIADGVVPSNEDRGYILRRIMRRAIQQGRTMGLEAPWLGRFAERTIEVMGEAYPELVAERESIARWVADEEESFGRTLERGSELLERLVAEARESETSWIDAADAFKLHDTYGFPYDLTKELLAEQGLSVDDQGFEELMDEQRQRARGGAATAHGSEDHHGRVLGFVSGAAPTRFVGYESLRARPASRPSQPDGERVLAKLEESPFYAEGGGQVADSGRVSWDGGEARVLDVYRVGDDQALELDGGRVGDWQSRVEAEVDRETRHATMRNHTATHLLHAALRERLGTHVRQAGSAVRPDKLRFDFTHGHALGPEELRGDRGPRQRMDQGEPAGPLARHGPRARPSGWGRWRCSARSTASGCGWSRSTRSRASSAAAPTSPTRPRWGSSRSSARARAPPTCAAIEALTGPAAIDWFRSRADELREAGELLGSPQDPLAGARRAAEQARQAGEEAGDALARSLGEESKRLLGEAAELGGISVVAAEAGFADQKQLLELANRVQSSLGGLGGGPRRRRRRQGRRWSPCSRRPRWSAASRPAPSSARPPLWSAAAGAVVMTWPRPAAATRRSSPRRSPPPGRRSSGGSAERMRVLALDYGTASIGCAVSDPSGTLVRPLAVIERADVRGGRPRRRGARAPSGSWSACRSTWTAARDARRQASRAFCEQLGEALPVPVETYDERLTTRMAQASRRAGAGAAEDSLAAAHLLEDYLAAVAARHRREGGDDT